MRIISGTARGTKLYTLEGIETRPTLDRVKESLFNIIQNDINDSNVLDLFAGSGAIGLEFASRNSKKCILCDDSKQAIEVIKKNVDKTHLNNKVILYNENYEKVIAKLENTKFDFIYLDPPYATDFIKKSLELIKKYNLADKNTKIIAETDEKERILKDIENLKLEIQDIRKYGRAYIIFINLDDSKTERG